MEHVVFHPGPDGSPAFRRLASLEDAVRYVEHLRNVEGVTDVSVHALSPVPLSFRAYYRVEVPAEGAEAAPADVPPAAPVEVAGTVVEPVAEPVVAPVAEPVLEPVAVAPEPVPVAEVPFEVPAQVEQPSNGKRSLGFFSH